MRSDKRSLSKQRKGKQRSCGVFNRLKCGLYKIVVCKSVNLQTYKLCDLSGDNHRSLPETLLHLRLLRLHLKVKLIKLDLKNWKKKIWLKSAAPQDCRQLYLPGLFIRPIHHTYSSDLFVRPIHQTYSSVLFDQTLSTRLLVTTSTHHLYSPAKANIVSLN